MVGHNEVVTLVLPHQIRNGLYLHIDIAGSRVKNLTVNCINGKNTKINNEIRKQYQ